MTILFWSCSRRQTKINLDYKKSAIWQSRRFSWLLPCASPCAARGPVPAGSCSRGAVVVPVVVVLILPVAEAVGEGGEKGAAKPQGGHTAHVAALSLPAGGGFRRTIRPTSRYCGGLQPSTGAISSPSRSHSVHLVRNQDHKQYIFLNISLCCFITQSVGEQIWSIVL